MPEVFSRRRRWTLPAALFAAVLVHGLALGGLIWFSSSADASKPLAGLDLHWISIVAPSERPERPEQSEPRGSAAPEMNSGSMPRSVSPPLAALELAASGAPAEPAWETVAGPAMESIQGPPIEPIKEPLKEPPVEPLKESVIATAAVAAPSAGPSGGHSESTHPVPPAAAKALIDPAGPSELHPRADSPHSPDSIAHPEPPHRVQAALPEPSRRAFDVYLGDFSLGQRVAAMDYLFESEGGHYRLRTEGRATGVMAMLYGGMLTQDSRGRVGPEGFLPERYSERRGERPARVVSFDRTTGLAEADDGSTQPLQAGVQDQLSAIWQLALIARMTPAQLALGHEFLWPIARGRRIHSMRIVSLGEENLHPSHSVPLRTLHLTLTSATAPDDGRLDVWLATDDAMQPIRMKMASAQGLVLDQIFRFPKHH